MNHLLGLETLDRAAIERIFTLARTYVDEPRRRWTDLKEKVIANLFFEPSTRTKLSFTLAARRLGAETVDFSPSGSSTVKGESFIDTARNIEAMGIDAMVVRHSSVGAPDLLKRYLQPNVHIVNAGDGAHEHPTQGLLDLFTIHQHRGDLSKLTIALVGDILHSRVARSNIHALRKYGATIIVCGPTTLVPTEVKQWGVRIAHNLDEILPECDVVNLLRVQFERQRSAFFPSVSEYARLFGMNGERMKQAKDDVLILAPGPINRGLELTPDVADGRNSVIIDQVSNGLAVRMAVLKLVCESNGVVT